MEEEDWFEINRNDFIKDDCLFSLLPSEDLQHYADCCNSCSRNSCYDAHCLLQSNKTEITSEYRDILINNDNDISFDGLHMPLGTLEEQLNLASNLFDVKIQLNKNYPNGMFLKLLNNLLQKKIYTIHTCIRDFT
ncbi:unnamed protein product [Cercopithifilaria johnstoni]|uniref:Uncharacterized protein n=1 Tax=Cercopithifilaria johnstoni TaxID=2874296 RepID=A0A8J2PZN2_9BILA|nr:unnamed protein product [Cercopithifilaria johnstoni]